MSVFTLVLPDFLLIALGWALLHKLKFSREFFQSAERLVYFVLFPALLFHSITQTPISIVSASTLLQATVAAMGFGIALAWLAVPVLKPDPIDHASTAQCAFVAFLRIAPVVHSACAGRQNGRQRILDRHHHVGQHTTVGDHYSLLADGGQRLDQIDTYAK